MSWQQLWKDYRELVLIIATAVATLVGTKVVPWLWRNLIVRAWDALARRTSRRWRERQFLRRHLDWIIEQNRYLETRGMKARVPVSVELEDIYVPLRARASLLEEPTTDARIDSLTAREQTSSPVIRALSDHKRIVLLGEPGSGKTTLLRFLAVTFARAIRHDRSQQDDLRKLSKRLGPTWGSPGARRLFWQKVNPIPLPLFLSLRTLAVNDLNRNKAIEVATLGMSRYLGNSYPDDFVENLLEGGGCIVLLDGLDEIREPDARRRAAEWIEELVASYPDNRYVVTSRIAGYSAPLGSGFQTWVLQEFTDDDIRLFVHHWYSSVDLTNKDDHPTVRDQAKQRADTLAQTILDTPRVRRLAVNPLLLSIIALVHHARIKLPERRIELYDNCATVLLGDWDEAKGIAGELRPDKKRLVLEPLAFRMQLAGAQDLPRAEVEAVLKEMLPKVGGTPNDAAQFLDEIRERSGLLVERGPEVFSFSHLTFQEYLAARHIRRTGQANLLHTHIADDHWREVVLLYCGLEDASGFVMRLLDRPDDIFHSRLLLSGQCLAEALATDPGLESAIAVRLEDQMLASEFRGCREAAAQVLIGLAPHQTVQRLVSLNQVAATSRPQSLAEALIGFLALLPDTVVLDLLRDPGKTTRVNTLAAIEQTKKMPDILVPAVLELLKNEDAQVREAAVGVLGTIPTPSAFTALSTCLLSDKDPKVRTAVAVALRAYKNPLTCAFLGAAVTDPEAAVMGNAGNSISQLVPELTNGEAARFALASALRTLRWLGNKEHRRHAILVAVGGLSVGLGVASILPARWMGLHPSSVRLKPSKKRGWLPRSVQFLYWIWFALITGLCQPILGVLISSLREASFFISFFRGLMAWFIDDPRAVLPIREFLISTDTKFRLLALRSIVVAMAEPELVSDYLHQAFENASDPDEALLAAYSLSSLDRSFALSTFVAAIEGANNPVILRAAVRALLFLKARLDFEALDAVGRALQSSVPEVRAMACTVLGSLKIQERIAAISGLLQDEDATVRVAACEALARLNSPSAIDRLRVLLSDNVQEVRDAAYSALWLICRQNAIELLP